MSYKIKATLSLEINIKRDGSGIPISFSINFNDVSYTQNEIEKFNSIHKNFTDNPLFWLVFFVHTHDAKTLQSQLIINKEIHEYYEVQAQPIGVDTLNVQLKSLDEDTYYHIKNQQKRAILDLYTPLLNENTIAVFILQAHTNTYEMIAHNFHTQSVINTNDEGYWIHFSKSQQNLIHKACNATIETQKVQKLSLDYDGAPLFTSYAPIFDVNGNLYIVITAIDKKKSEDATQRSPIFSNYFYTLFSQLQTNVVITDRDTHKIIDANPYALEFYGYTREEFLTMGLEDYNVNPLIVDPTRSLSKIPHRLKDGTIRYLDIYVNIIKVGDRYVRISFAYDVSEAVSLSESHFKESKFLSSTLSSINEAVITLDENNRISGFNHAADEVLGKGFLSSDEKRDVLIRTFDTHEPVSIQSVLRLNSKNKNPTKYEISTNSIDWIPISFTITTTATDGQKPSTVIVFRDISNELEYIEQMKLLSFYDVLTGLYSKSYMDMLMASPLKERDYPMGIVFAKANDIQRINDLYGVEVGDKFLQEITTMIQNNFKKNALVTRWGGDEFLIMSPATTCEQLQEIIKNINLDIDTHNVNDISPSFSMGYTVVNDASEKLQDHIETAEKFMYSERRISAAQFRNKVIDGYLMQLYESRGETKEHSIRLESLCYAMGTKIHLGESHMQSLSSLALLHDIGKTKIDLSIIDKPTDLSCEEWETMKLHPQYGFDITTQFSELSTVAYLILTHHERWDGTGYPLKLSEDSIPIESRILAIVDAFDVMTHNRPYHQAMSVEEAKVELKRNAGTQFDPELVEAFLSLPQSVFKDI